MYFKSPIVRLRTLGFVDFIQQLNIVSVKYIANKGTVYVILCDPEKLACPNLSFKHLLN